MCFGGLEYPGLAILVVAVLTRCCLYSKLIFVCPKPFAQNDTCAFWKPVLRCFWLLNEDACSQWLGRIDRGWIIQFLGLGLGIGGERYLTCIQKVWKKRRHPPSIGKFREERRYAWEDCLYLYAQLLASGNIIHQSKANWVEASFSPTWGTLQTGFSLTKLT